ncbi:MAG: transposase [Betaproteobacteria bacterium]|nr:transposase [Betaproteobacteria bacterium]
MPRRSRLNLTDVPQHVIQRGNNRQVTFFAEADYLYYLDCLSSAARKFDCRIYAYVIMTNHVHLLVSAHEPYAISRMMQHLGRCYVKHFNAIHGRSGTLWEGRFRANLVDTESYFLRCCRYIECNPVRARMVADPADYRWSSHRAHILGEQDRLIVAHDQYLRLGTTDGERQLAYRELFREGIDARELSEIRDTVNRGWPMGSERFKDEIERALACEARPPKRGRPRRAKLPKTSGLGEEKLL